MPPSSPDTVESLLSTPDGVERERAWTAFLAGYSEVLLRVARAMGGDHDAVMDRYTFILDALCRDDYRRLRAYAVIGRSSFETWLAVVARRLCMDEYRHRYGRAQSSDAAAEAERATRRNLTDLVGDELGYDVTLDVLRDSPDVELQNAELRDALDSALARLEVVDRLILRMRFEDDLSVPEIARLLNLGSPFGAYRRLKKVLAQVRTDLETAGIRDGRL